jgi:hypothetical protein
MIRNGSKVTMQWKEDPEFDDEGVTIFSIGPPSGALALVLDPAWRHRGDQPALLHIALTRKQADAQICLP